jgi:hypothetical protein
MRARGLRRWASEVENVWASFVGRWENGTKKIKYKPAGNSRLKD